MLSKIERSHFKKIIQIDKLTVYTSPDFLGSSSRVLELMT